MSRVLVTVDVPATWLTPLAEHEVRFRDEYGGSGLNLTESVSDVEGILCVINDRLDGTLLKSAPLLKVVATVGVGFDHIDVDAATAHGIAVCNTPGLVADSTADLAFALILSAARLLSTAEFDLRNGLWSKWSIDQYLGVDVAGATLGLVGYGRVGRAVERRARGFDMKVIHHGPSNSGLPGYVESLDELVASADIVSLHVPLNRATFHLFDRRRLSLMKPTAVLVNTSRGPVVDEEELAVALERGRLFAAGLDVYEAEPKVHPRLLAAPRTVLLPHIGGATRATRKKMVLSAAASIRAVLEGESVTTAVNAG